jgi:TetR/AcrR family fatty acid metabolism transcriptional regulator
VTQETRDKPERRDQILEAALEVFSRRGVFATRIADIAAEAGVAYGLVYHYFRNKEEILHTIFEVGWAELQGRLEAAEGRSGGARARFLGMAEAFLDAYRRRPRVVELFMLEFSGTSRFPEAPQLGPISKALAVVTRILERGRAEGEIRADLDVDLLTLIFIGSLQLLVQAQVLGVYTLPEDFKENGARKIVDAFFDGVGVK